MGVDAQGYFVTKRALTDKEINRIEQDYKNTYGDTSYSFRSLRGNKDFTAQCVKIDFYLARFYSPTYTRGPALDILTVLGWLRRRPYVEAVYYGGDCYAPEEFTEWTEASERELLETYLKQGWRSYCYPLPEPYWDGAL